jgi:hypothetical protein
VNNKEILARKAGTKMGALLDPREVDFIDGLATSQLNDRLFRAML